MAIVLMITAALTAAGCVTLTVLGRSYVAKPGPVTAAADDAQIRPALVHFVIANCKPGIAAYEATILDLAARGFLAASAHPTGLWLAYTEAGARAAAATPLAAHEQGVLDSMHGRLKNTGGAPFVALAQACRVDVEGTWRPFEQKLGAEARRRGLCRRRLPLTPAFGAAAGITTVALGTFAGVVAASRPHAGIVGTIIVAWIAWFLSTLILAGASYRDRLTSLGAMLAARWTREQAALAATPFTWAEGDLDALARRAFAAALSVPGAGLGSSGRAGRVVAERPSTSKMPSQAWSSFTGSWRLVKIEKTAKAGMSGAINALVTGIIIGVIDLIVAVLAGFNSWEFFVAAVAVAFGGTGAFYMVRISAIPTRLTFEAQVIARWVISNSSDGATPYYAVDDGTKAWVFSGEVALEDILRITVNPRNGELIEYAVLAHQRPETPVEISQPSLLRRLTDQLLATPELTELIGPVSRTTPLPGLAGFGTVYRGRDGTLILSVTRGGLKAFNMIVRDQAGTPLPDVGDGAWLFTKDSGAAVRVGDQMAMLRATGEAAGQRPDLLAKIAVAVATTLASPAAPAGPAPTTPAW